MNGEQYLGNVDNYRVHDLDNEQGDCQIDAIIDAGKDQPFVRLGQAHKEVYEDCENCLP